MEPHTPLEPITGYLASPEAESWHAFRRQSEQETPKRLKEAAKYLSGIISIVFTLLLTRDAAVFQRPATGVQVTTATFCLLLALLATLFVLFPIRWKQVSVSADSIAQAHRASVTYKYRLLVAGVCFFMAGLGLLGWVYVH